MIHFYNVIVSISTNAYLTKYATLGDAFGLVTHVDQTWNSLLEGLERIDAAMEDYISSSNGGDHGALF